jgi:hypothetical protein
MARAQVKASEEKRGLQHDSCNRNKIEDIRRLRTFINLILVSDQA